MNDGFRSHSARLCDFHDVGEFFAVMESKMHTRLFAALALAAAVSGSAIAQTPATNQPPAKPIAPVAAPATPAAPAAAAPAATTAATARTAPASLVDINAASLADLQKLKGIGQARAEAIIKGRPYKAKDELVEKKILPKNVYDDVKDQIVARHRS